MSGASSSGMSELNDIINTYRRNGAIFLFLFKLLKIRVEEQMWQDNPSVEIDEQALNEFCVRKADHLANSVSENPMEEDIWLVIKQLVE